MNCHIVPQCYLKAWKIHNTKKSIYIFKKDKTIAYANKNIENLSDTSFAIKDKYILDFYSKEYMHKFYNEFSMLVNELQVKPFYHGKIIDNVDAYFEYLDNIDDWVFKNNSTNKLISSSEFELIWNRNFGKIIENYFNIQLENKWPQLIDYTITHISKRSWKVKSKYNQILIEFVVVQLLRRDINMYNMGLNWLADILSDIFTTSSCETTQELFDDKFKESLWLMQLYKYTQYKANPVKENENAIITCIEKINELFQPCFLIAPKSITFITSDNPCYIIKSSDTGLTAGIYLPIMPNVCVFLCNCRGRVDKTKYYIMDVCNQNVKYINHLTKSSSIRELANFDNDISNMFSEEMDLKSWRKMLGYLFKDLKI